MALDPRFMSRAQADNAHVDVGLRQYMLGVYNHMTIGLAITGLVALPERPAHRIWPGYLRLAIEMGSHARTPRDNFPV